MILFTGTKCPDALVNKGQEKFVLDFVSTNDIIIIMLVKIVEHDK